MATRKKAKSGSDRQLLRHTLATLAYRGGKALRDVPEGFAGFRVGDKTRTPGQILAHMGDLLDWALSLAKGAQKWHNSPALPWKDGTDRFFWALRAFDKFLVSDAPLGTPASGLFQGPIADAFTHVGQISMLRRLAGAPVRGENYLQADVTIGRVGPKQSTPKREFD
ncbi:MAG: hypothetical protein WA581_01915 [Candidatus Acidiferrales bacterium]